MSSFISLVESVFDSFVSNFRNINVPTNVILTVLGVVTILAIYEFVVYHLVLRRALYNKAFNICIALIPYFISTIILCLQSSMIITLGTIGALAIIRFRTAVKDPVDMIFLFWSIHIGIVCGCQLYELGFITSLAVTIVLVLVNLISVNKKSHILIVHCKNDESLQSIEKIIRNFSLKYRIKSRCYLGKSLNIVIELVTKNVKEISKEISETKGVEKFSLMEYDPDDIL